MFLIRDLVAGRTWLALIHHTAGVIVGLAAFFGAATLLTLGVGLLPLMLCGFPVIGLMLRLLGWLAQFERARFEFLVGQRIPAWPARSRAGYRFWLVPRWKAYAQRATWGEVGYALARLPVSLVCWALAIVTWSVGLVLLTMPLYDGSLPAGGAVIDGHVFRAIPPVLAACVLCGAGLLLAAPRVTRGLASGQRRALSALGARCGRWLGRADLELEQPFLPQRALDRWRLSLAREPGLGQRLAVALAQAAPL
jgi:hypothetical protein